VFYDRKFRRKMRKLTIYIARHRHSTAHSAHSEPCSHCAKEIKRFGIKKIVYVDGYGEINKSLADKYHTDYVCPGYKEYAKQGVKVD
jgi:deoxycytidylate deaminase|tara:strand:+ start:1576 stop:1836 length:261 start_codon:yes stop_codon:yes gene_type:complete